MNETAEVNDALEVTDTETDVSAEETQTNPGDTFADSTAEAQEHETAEPSDSSTEKQDAPDKVQKKFDKLTFEKHEARREAEYWRNQANQQQQPPEPAPAQQQPEPLRTLEDFEYNESQYQAYLFQTSQNNAVEAARRVLKEEQAQSEQSRKFSEFQSKENEFSKDKSDYFDVTRSLPNFSQVMVEVTEDMDTGVDIRYHLGKNPDVADKIARMSPLAAARELGKIDAKLEYAKEQKGKTVSSAPAPPPKIDAVTPSMKVDIASKEGDKLSTDEWLKRRNKQLDR